MWAKSFLIFFSNFRMDQTLERMNKSKSTPDPLATRVTLSSYLETGSYIIIVYFLRRSLNFQLENPGSSNTLVEKVDHQLEVDGVIYRKLRTINRVVSQVFLQIFN